MDAAKFTPPSPRVGTAASACHFLQERKIDLVINDPESGDKEIITDGYLIRRTAVDFGVSLITNTKVAALLSLALVRVKTFHIKSMDVSARCGHAFALPLGVGGAVLVWLRDLRAHFGRYRCVEFAVAVWADRGRCSCILVYCDFMRYARCTCL